MVISSSQIGDYQFDSFDAQAVLTVHPIECYVDSIGSLYDRDIAKGHGRVGRQFNPMS